MREPPLILVVDDVPDNVDILQMRLESQGYEVTTAGDGEAALAIIRDKLPDLVLLDIMMPKLDGIATVKQLKADKGNESAVKADRAKLLADRIKLQQDMVAGLTARLTDRQNAYTTIFNDCQAIVTTVKEAQTTGKHSFHEAMRTGLQRMLHLIKFQQHLIGVRRPVAIAFLLAQRAQGDQAGVVFRLAGF